MINLVWYFYRASGSCSLTTVPGPGSTVVISAGDTSQFSYVLKPLNSDCFNFALNTQLADWTGNTKLYSCQSVTIPNNLNPITLTCNVARNAIPLGQSVEIDLIPVINIGFYYFNHLTIVRPPPPPPPSPPPPPPSPPPPPPPR